MACRAWRPLGVSSFSFRDLLGPGWETCTRQFARGSISKSSVEGEQGRNTGTWGGEGSLLDETSNFGSFSFSACSYGFLAFLLMPVMALEDEPDWKAKFAADRSRYLDDSEHVW